jgi:hypothetical protein
MFAASTAKSNPAPAAFSSSFFNPAAPEEEEEEEGGKVEAGGALVVVAPPAAAPCELAALAAAANLAARKASGSTHMLLLDTSAVYPFCARMCGLQMVRANIYSDVSPMGSFQLVNLRGERPPPRGVVSFAGRRGTANWKLAPDPIATKAKITCSFLPKAQSKSPGGSPSAVKKRPSAVKKRTTAKYLGTSPWRFHVFRRLPLLGIKGKLRGYNVLAPMNKIKINPGAKKEISSPHAPFATSTSNSSCATLRGGAPSLRLLPPGRERQLLQLAV